MVHALVTQELVGGGAFLTITEILKSFVLVVVIISIPLCSLKRWSSIAIIAFLKSSGILSKAI